MTVMISAAAVIIAERRVREVFPCTQSTPLEVFPFERTSVEGIDSGITSPR